MCIELRLHQEGQVQRMLVVLLGTLESLQKRPCIVVRDSWSVLKLQMLPCTAQGFLGGSWWLLGPCLMDYEDYK